MDEQTKQQLIARIQARLTGQPMSKEEDVQIKETLERLVGIGACRIGLSLDSQNHDEVLEACRLAPPIARLIDHTALKPDTTEEQIRKLCEEAKTYCFASVCVNPCYVPLAAQLLENTPIAVCTVIGFPLGANRTPTKAFETELAVAEGANEVDMVINIGFLKSKKYEEVEEDIRAVVEAARPRHHEPHTRNRALVKVIIETALLTDEEKVIASILAMNAGADFVKTSTGFSKGGATPYDVALIRRVVGDKLGIKASGGIRSLEDAQKMVEAGATRIGASASVQIVRGRVGDSDY